MEPPRLCIEQLLLCIEQLVCIEQQSSNSLLLKKVSLCSLLVALMIYFCRLRSYMLFFLWEQRMEVVIVGTDPVASLIVITLDDKFVFARYFSLAFL